MTATDLIPGTLGWLLTYAIHSTVLLGMAWLFSLRARSHGTREVIWKAALVGGFVTATGQQALEITPLTGTVVVATTPSAPVFPPGSEPIPAGPAQESTFSPGTVDRDAYRAAAQPGGIFSGLGAGGWVVLGWAAVAVVLVALYGIRRARWLRRLSGRRPVMTHPLAQELERLTRAAGITRPIRLTVTEQLASPIALGRNEIAVPEAALVELDPDQQRGMLAHELAHLERRDPAWLLGSVLIERIAFFQPLNRLARRRIQESAEYLCDEWAVRRTGSEGGVSLASCLAKVAEWLEAAPAIPVAGMAEERSHLVGRVRRLLDGAPFSRGPGRRTVLIGGALAVFGAILAVPAVAPGHQTEETRSSVDTEIRDERQGVSQDSVRVIVRALMAAAKDPEVEVRRAALQSLARYEDPSSLSAFREALRDADAEVRATAVHALAELKDRTSTGEIAALLSDENREIRRAAAHALAELPDRSVMDRLVAALADSDAEVRAGVVRALAELKDPAAAGPLTAALKDAKAEVRARAIEALQELELSSPPAGLLEALRDPSAEARHAAAHAVAHYKDARAVSALRGLLEDPSEDVREAAVEALAEIRTEDALSALMGALKSKDPKVRRAAAEALGQR